MSKMPMMIILNPTDRVAMFMACIRTICVHLISTSLASPNHSNFTQRVVGLDRKVHAKAIAQDYIYPLFFFVPRLIRLIKVTITGASVKSAFV